LTARKVTPGGELYCGLYTGPYCLEAIYDFSNTILNDEKQPSALISGACRFARLENYLLEHAMIVDVRRAAVVRELGMDVRAMPNGAKKAKVVALQYRTPNHFVFGLKGILE